MHKRIRRGKILVYMTPLLYHRHESNIIKSPLVSVTEQQLNMGEKTGPARPQATM